MNSSRESAAREQWMRDAVAEIEARAVDEPSERDAGAAAQYSFDKELAVDIIASHYAAREREEWIPVSDAPLGVAILIHVTTSCYPMIATRTQVGWFSAASANCIDESVITHWRPLPAAPAAKGETDRVAAQGEQHD